ncbi:MAG: GlsB/YeaQ/YmgE family stress response membrane protein [Actinocatenispora sp.]
MIGTIVWAIIAGAVLGVIGRLILPGRQNIPWWAMIGVGIVAAFVGGLIAQAFGVDRTHGIDWIKHAIQVVLAVIGIAIVAGAFGRRRHTTSQI